MKMAFTRKSENRTGNSQGNGLLQLCFYLSVYWSSIFGGKKFQCANQLVEKKKTLSAPGKLKNSNFKIPIIPRTLSINNLRTASAKSVKPA